MPIERIAFSEKDRRGIGTFTPTDPKSQDISELIGGIDLSTIGEVGSESDPRAYRFDGELNIANRGMMEFIEMLKTDERFLYVLLTLSQEQNIKTGRFSMIYADEVVVSHTNEHEYNAFVGNRKREALQDRIILVKVPYNLRVTDEVHIYEKLLRQSAASDVHIAPHTLRNGRHLRRPVPAGGVQEGRHEPDEEAEALRRRGGRGASPRRMSRSCATRRSARGMDGISPRYVINRLSSALVRDGVTCINAIDALRGAARRPGPAHLDHQGAARALAQPDRRGAQGVRRVGQEGGPARLRLRVRGVGQDAAEQLPRQRRSLLQQDEGAPTR